MEAITNPFTTITDRLDSIESLLATIAAKEKTQPTEKKFYSIAEAAEKLNVATITLYRNVNAGKIPFKKVGERIMIPGSYVDNL